MKEVKAIIQGFLLDKVIDALHELPHLPGITVSAVSIHRRSDPELDSKDLNEEAKMAKIELVLPDSRVEEVVRTIARAAHTGRSGDGKIFISEISDVVRIRTGERGEMAI